MWRESWELAKRTLAVARTIGRRRPKGRHARARRRRPGARSRGPLRTFQGVLRRCRTGVGRPAQGLQRRRVARPSRGASRAAGSSCRGHRDGYRYPRPRTRSARAAGRRGRQLVADARGGARQADRGRRARRGAPAREASALPLADAEMDAALAHMVLQYLPSPGDAIREMARSVRPVASSSSSTSCATTVNGCAPSSASPGWASPRPRSAAGSRRLGSPSSASRPSLPSPRAETCLRASSHPVGVPQTRAGRRPAASRTHQKRASAGEGGFASGCMRPAPVPSCQWRFRAVLFDAAGTLIRLREPVGETYRRLAISHGVTLPASRIEEAFRRVLRQAPPMVWPGRAASAGRGARAAVVATTVVRGSFRAADASARFTDFEGYFETLFEYFARPEAWDPAPGAMETLCALRARGSRTGVVSNFDHRLAGLLEGLGLAPRLRS